jgi:prolyl-tRNA editing enzyme YbaK/EbsC (Cys-tRNA(Pro) deacylase)
MRGGDAKPRRGQGEYPKPVALHPTAQRLQDDLHELGLGVEIRELSDSTRTAQEAADAVGVDVGQIVKSLVFVDEGGPLLCLCAGDRRVDTAKLGEHVRQARGDEVREATGFAIGGVPPLGHDPPVRTVVDASLRRFATVWCAGGTPHAVFPVGTEALISAIPGADVREIS